MKAEITMVRRAALSSQKQNNKCHQKINKSLPPTTITTRAHSKSIFGAEEKWVT